MSHKCNTGCLRNPVVVQQWKNFNAARHDTNFKYSAENIDDYWAIKGAFVSCADEIVYRLPRDRYKIGGDALDLRYRANTASCTL